MPEGCQPGATLLFRGMLGVSVSLIRLTAVRFNFSTFHRRMVGLAALPTIVPLTFAIIVVLGLAIGGPRRISDTMASIFLFLVPAAVVVALWLDAGLGRRKNTSWLRVAVQVVIALMIAAGLTWFGISTGDFLSSFILFAIPIPAASQDLPAE